MLLLLPVALTACGGDAVALDPVASAATRTSSTTSSRVAFSMTMSLPNGQSLDMAGRGMFDSSTRVGELSMQLGLPAAMQSQLPGAPRLQLIMDGSNGLVMYMSSPMFGPLPGGKTWLKLDVAKVAKSEGVDLSKEFSQLNTADPSQSLKYLMAASNARAVGRNRIRGVLTTHYDLVVDLHRLASEDPAQKDTLDKAISLLGIDSYPAEAWVDSHGLVRRFQLSMRTPSTLGGSSTVTLTEDLYGFGKPVSVSVPDAGSVLDATSIAGS